MKQRKRKKRVMKCYGGSVWRIDRSRGKGLVKGSRRMIAVSFGKKRLVFCVKIGKEGKNIREGLVQTEERPYTETRFF